MDRCRQKDQKKKKKARPLGSTQMVCDLILSGSQSQVLGGWCSLRLLMKREPVVGRASGGDD